MEFGKSRQTQFNYFFPLSGITANKKVYQNLKLCVSLGTIAMVVQRCQIHPMLTVQLDIIA